MISVMSFNLLCIKPDDARKDRVLTMIREQLPDILGVQEALPHWMAVLTGALENEYAYYGEGREGKNQGEYNTIFLKKGVLNIIEKGVKWLTDTPDVVSVFKESSCYRILTYTVLEVKKTGRRFLCVNTHLEHTDEKVRARQVRVLIDFAKDYDMPVVLTGDFNCECREETYRLLLAAGYRDVKRPDDPQSGIKTFHGYRSREKDHMLIDYIFIKGCLQAKKYDVLNRKINGEYASDHHPVKAVIAFCK